MAYKVVIIIAVAILASCSRVEQDAPVVVMTENNVSMKVSDHTAMEETSEPVIKFRHKRPLPAAKRIALAMSPGETENEDVPAPYGLGESSGVSDIMDFLWDIGFTSAGFRAGANYSSTESSTSASRGTLLGIAAEMNLARIGDFTLALEMDINYLRRDISLERGVVYTEYMSLPIIGKMRWPAAMPGIPGRFQLYSGLGIDPNFRLTSHFHHVADNADYRYDSNPWDMAVLFNLGGEISMGSFGSVVTELRYSYGLTPATAGQTMYFKNFGYEDINIREERVNSYMLVLGYNYRMRN